MKQNKEMFDPTDLTQDLTLYKYSHSCSPIICYLDKTCTENFHLLYEYLLLNFHLIKYV